MKQEIKKYLESETRKNNQDIEINRIYLKMVKVVIFTILSVIVGAIISLFFI